MTVIVLPSDGSPFSVAASQRLLAPGLFERPLHVHLVHASTEIVGRPQAYFSKEQIDQWAADEAEDAFAPVRPILRAAKVLVTEHRDTGEPADVIVQVARTSGADAIVMGTHGRGAFLASVLGSVASRVVATAPVPVLLVPRRVGTWPEWPP